MSRKCRGEVLQHRPGCVEQLEFGKLNDGAAIPHRGAFATAGAHTDPGDAAGNATLLRLRTLSAHANHGVIPSGSYTAHAVTQAEDSVRRRIAGMSTLVDQDSW